MYSELLQPLTLTTHCYYIWGINISQFNPRVRGVYLFAGLDYWTHEFNVILKIR